MCLLLVHLHISKPAGLVVLFSSRAQPGRVSVYKQANRMPPAGIGDGGRVKAPAVVNKWLIFGYLPDPARFFHVIIQDGLQVKTFA